MYFQASVGINIENNRVSVVYLKRTLKGLFLGGYAIHPLEKAGVEDTAAETARLVNEFLDLHKIPSADIFLGIQRDVTILRYIELPLAVKENLRGTLLYEMEKYVPLSVSDIYFDFQIIDEDKAAGKLTVLLIAVRKEFVDPFFDSDHCLGTGVSGVEIGSTALVNCCSRKTGPPSAESYAFLLLNDDHFELGFVKQGLLRYSRHVAADTKAGDFRRLVSEELAMLRKTLGPGHDHLEIISCGSPDGSVAEVFREREDVYSGSIDLSGTGLPSDLLAPAYGLALKGLRKTPMDINLLPVDLRKKVSKTAYYAMFGLAGLLLVAFLVWGASNIMHQRYVAGKLANELERLGAEVTAIHQTREKLEELEHRIDALNMLRGRHVPVLNVLRELTGEIPEGAWFTRLYITDEKGDVEGYADSASALIPLLAASPLLKDAAFLSPITKDKDGKERFRIGFTLR